MKAVVARRDYQTAVYVNTDHLLIIDFENIRIHQSHDVEVIAAEPYPRKEVHYGDIATRPEIWHSRANQGACFYGHRRANAAIFSVVNAVLIRPLPYQEPDRLVQFWETNPLKNWTQANVAPANLFDWEKQNTSFGEMAAYMGSDTKEAGLAGFQWQILCLRERLRE